MGDKEKKKDILLDNCMIIRANNPDAQKRIDEINEQIEQMRKDTDNYTVMFVLNDNDICL